MPASVEWKSTYFDSPMPVHCRSLPCNPLGFPNNLVVPIYDGTYLKALWELSVLPKNTTVSLVRAPTWTAQSRDKCTNHEATTQNLFSSQSVSHRLSNSVLFWCHSSGSIRTQYPLPSTGSSNWKKTSWSRVKPFNSLIYNVCYVLIWHDFVFPKGLTHQHSLLGSTFFLLVVNYKHA